MRVLISGVAGQVGSHVADALLARGDEVWGIDNFATGKEFHLPKSPNFHFVEGTIADEATVEKLFAEARPDAVVHTAASYKNPDDWSEDIQTNVRGMKNLIAGAKDTNAKQFVYFQTALIYGVVPLENPITLNHPRRYDNSSYSISKGAAEDYLELSGLPHVTFRLANVIGPRCQSGPLPIFYDRITSGKQCFVTDARRDFVYVGDLVRAVVRAVDGTGSGAYHFSSGSDIAVLDLYNAIVDGLGITPELPVEIRPAHADDAPSILLDPTRTFQDFGAIEFTPLEVLVANSIEYYREFGAGDGHTHLKATKS